MRRYELTLPDLGIRGPTTVSLWLVEPGNPVAEDQPVVEIVAGDAVVDLPAPAAGRLAQVLVAEDDPVEVGQVLAVIESDWDDDF
jgi:pyruvate/2-oxoglutarate dehydrogenase complex dihydrolipoamide acyltransferase (E2) component